MDVLKKSSTHVDKYCIFVGRDKTIGLYPEPINWTKSWVNPVCVDAAHNINLGKQNAYIPENSERLVLEECTFAHERCTCSPKKRKRFGKASYGRRARPTSNFGWTTFSISDIRPKQREYVNKDIQTGACVDFGTQGENWNYKMQSEDGSQTADLDEQINMIKKKVKDVEFFYCSNKRFKEEDDLCMKTSPDGTSSKLSLEAKMSKSLKNFKNHSNVHNETHNPPRGCTCQHCINPEIITKLSYKLDNLEKALFCFIESKKSRSSCCPKKSKTISRSTCENDKENITPIKQSDYRIHKEDNSNIYPYSIGPKREIKTFCGDTQSLEYIKYSRALENKTKNRKQEACIESTGKQMHQYKLLKFSIT